MHWLQCLSFHLALLGYRKGKRELTLESFLFEDEELEGAFTEPVEGYASYKKANDRHMILEIVYHLLYSCCYTNDINNTVIWGNIHRAKDRPRHHPAGVGCTSRTLAWALTIHKSQG